MLLGLALAEWVPALAEWVPALAEWVLALAEWVPALAEWVLALAEWVPALAEWVLALAEWVLALAEWVLALAEWVLALAEWVPALVKLALVKLVLLALALAALFLEEAPLGLEVEVKESIRARRASELRKKLAAGEKIEAQDKEHRDAKALLIGEMKKKGTDNLYNQGPLALTNAEGANVLEQERRDADKHIRESADTDKLARKLERKLGEFMEGKTPANMQDAMSDVVIESARPLAEHLVDKAYKTAVKEALIDAMQRKDNAVLVDQDGDKETFFYAAQRLKKAESLTGTDPNTKLAHEIVKKLEDSIRFRPLPRKMSGTMKEHVKQAGDYLSEHVTNPDPEIDALVDLLFEMENAGSRLLVDGDNRKTHKEAASYLKTLTSFEDKIGKHDPQLQGEIQSEMKKLMEKVPLIGYSAGTRNKVIQEQAGLLTSHLLQNGQKKGALKALLDTLNKTPDAMILRHGSARKAFFDAAQVLHGKDPAQLLNVRSVDPIVARKLQIRLTNIMEEYLDMPFMSDVIDDATDFLAVHLLLPQTMRVCKCMKSVFIQCELWNEEILRRVARPSCTCSQRRVAERPNIFSQGIKIDMKECPTMHTYTKEGPYDPCPANVMGEPCESTINAYVLQTEPHFEPAVQHIPTRLRPASANIPMLRTPGAKLAADFMSIDESTWHAKSMPCTRFVGELDNLQHQPLSTLEPAVASTSYITGTGSPTVEPAWNVFAEMQSRRTRSPAKSPKRSNRIRSPTLSPSSNVNDAPVVTTDQMADMYAMMVSLMWNMQAWRRWLQEIFDRALASQIADLDSRPDQAYAEWVAFHQNVMKEALQWKQYIKFSKQLTIRLEHRYKDKQIVSPTRASNKTEAYKDCQMEMLEITEMFNKWTQWLIAVLKESQAKKSYNNTPLHIVCWKHLKDKVQTSLIDWLRYNSHLKTCWEHKYKTIMSASLSNVAWDYEGPVWVMSACGAVPSGAVSAGIHNGEVIWVVRTTHKSEVLPGALVPSQHSCLIYADGAIQKYSKYQVLCNADVEWVAWRAGLRYDATAHAVCVAPGVYVGRIEYQTHHLIGAVLAPNYRCHVVIHKRPFTFDCFELLVTKEKSVSEDSESDNFRTASEYGSSQAKLN
ncbi:hypothetical protein O0L34_g9476 [Tuta absoluta]|nr:hypothetical protein O0L34_g9476 [Tuta absoluta]